MSNRNEPTPEPRTLAELDDVREQLDEIVRRLSDPAPYTPGEQQAAQIRLHAIREILGEILDDGAR